MRYSKICVKRPLSKRPKIVFQDQLWLNAGQSIAECSKVRILSTNIKLPFAIKTFIFSIFEWLFYTGFTVHLLFECSFSPRYTLSYARRFGSFFLD